MKVNVEKVLDCILFTCTILGLIAGIGLMAKLTLNYQYYVSELAKQDPYFLAKGCVFAMIMLGLLLTVTSLNAMLTYLIG